MLQPQDDMIRNALQGQIDAELRELDRVQNWAAREIQPGQVEEY